MEKIAVTGGKGGVGKSTVSVLLANKFRSEGKKVVLVDLDVECPNDHLLLGQELGEVKKQSFAKFPKLNKRKCTKCLPRGSEATLRGGLCVEKCPDNAIFQPPEDYPVFVHGLCAGCGLCWNICPFGAIEVEEKVTGKIFVSQLDSLSARPKDFSAKENLQGLEDPTLKVEELAEAGELDKSNVCREGGNMWLVTGRSVGIVEETGPIVAEVKEYAYQLAEKKEADVILLDTAPGLHCAVIRALWEVDKAYAVTEPTPLGAHDLKLILELLKKLEVPSKVILNQADLGDRKLVDKIVEDFDSAYEYEIPYSEQIVKAYSEGKLGSFAMDQWNN